jgi:hypothetical protein
MASEHQCRGLSNTDICMSHQGCRRNCKRKKRAPYVKGADEPPVRLKPAGGFSLKSPCKLPSRLNDHDAENMVSTSNVVTPARFRKSPCPLWSKLLLKHNAEANGCPSVHTDKRNRITTNFSITTLVPVVKMIFGIIIFSPFLRVF